MKPLLADSCRSFAAHAHQADNSGIPLVKMAPRLFQRTMLQFALGLALLSA
jgi:hypothetical protein